MIRRALAGLAFLLAAPASYAAIVATCDPVDPVVPGRLRSVVVRAVDAAELADPARIVWESPARPGARAITEWDERGRVYVPLERAPSPAVDKCDRGAIVPMTRGELDAIAAVNAATAERADRDAAAAAFDDLRWKALVAALVEELNALRTRLSLPPLDAATLTDRLRTKADEVPRRTAEDEPVRGRTSGGAP